MRDWLERIGLKMEGWMIGRYGQDELNQFLLYVSLALILCSVAVPELSYLALIILGFAMFRCYSKNVYKRKQERETYFRLTRKPRQWYRLMKWKWRDRDIYRYYTCKACGAVFRVPKGKGNIEITCPGCGDKQIRKT